MTGLLLSFPIGAPSLNTESKGVLFDVILCCFRPLLFEVLQGHGVLTHVQGIAVSTSPWELPLWMFAGERGGQNPTSVHGEGAGSSWYTVHTQDHTDT